jgi:hypothetical protein
VADIITLAGSNLGEGCQYTQHNDAQHKDIQRNDTQPKGLIFDTQLVLYL